jgi:hypothetical protein
MMDYANIRAAIQRGNAADTVPGLALSMLRDIVSGRSGMTAVRHPLGFLCFPAQRRGKHGVCLHLWASALGGVVPMFQVHSHSWDLTSYVLYGTVRNQLIRVTEAPASATHRVFEVRSHGDVDELHATSRLVSFEPEAECECGPGRVYEVPAGKFHRTVLPGDRDVATVALGLSRPRAVDRALGPTHVRSHIVTRTRCDVHETVRAALAIAGQLEAAGVT